MAVQMPSPEQMREVAERCGLRDWLFALALADPESAKKLADRLCERAKTNRTGRNSLSGAGLVEMASILVAKDRYVELAIWGHLIRPMERDD